MKTMEQLLQESRDLIGDLNKLRSIYESMDKQWPFNSRDTEMGMVRVLNSLNREIAETKQRLAEVRDMIADAKQGDAK